MTKYLFIGIAFGFLLLLAVGVFSFRYAIREPFPLSQREVFFTITPGKGVKDIGYQLEKEHIIKQEGIFYWYAKIFGGDRSIQAGEYRVNSPLTIEELFALFKKGPNAQVAIIFPEGFTIKQIVSRLNANGFNFKEEDFSHMPEDFRIFYFESARNKLAYNLPKGASLEGFLFPDRYVLRMHESKDEVIRAFLSDFQARVPYDWVKAIEASGHSMSEIVTMASILEREVKTPEERKIASGILWKRLKTGIPLQVDATINYVAGKPKEVTDVNIMLDSPYNTYKHKGLPPGPISNPGLASIQAAIFPEESEYWFYLSRQDTGETIFSKTLEEHNKAKATYLK